MSKDEEAETAGANVAPSTSPTLAAIGNESDSAEDVSEPVTCPEPKSATKPVTPSVSAVKTKQQIEEEEREKMQ